MFFGNYQFQFKDPSGIMLLASSVHARDMARDNWMNAKEAVEYGLCDEIISKIEL